MESATKTRSRGVALNADGIEALNQAVAQRWVALNEGDKLTRLAKAEFLGVSEATLVRMLAGKRVDRISLEISFARAGIVLKPSLLSGASQAPERAIIEAPAPPAPRRWSVVALVAAASTLAIAGWFSNRPPDGYPVTPRREHEMVLQLAYKSYENGEYILAQSTLDSAVILAKRAGIQNEIPHVWRLQADIDTAVGNYDHAEGQLRKCLALHLLKKDAETIPPLLEGIGVVQTLKRNYAEATRTLEQSSAGFAKFRVPTGIAMCLRDLGTISYETNAMTLANQRFEAALSQIDNDPEQEPLRMDIRARRALVTARLGNHDSARKELQLCFDFWRVREHAKWMATTRYQMGVVELEASDRKRAGSYLGESLVGYQQVHDVAGAEKVRELLSRLKL